MSTLSRRYAVTLVLLCTLFLLGAQQAAFVHLLSHLGARAESVGEQQDGGSRGKLPDLSHVCTTCAAFATLDAAPLPSGLTLAVRQLPSAPQRHAALGTTAHFSSQYRARAPPALL